VFADDNGSGAVNTRRSDVPSLFRASVVISGPSIGPDVEIVNYFLGIQHEHFPQCPRGPRPTSARRHRQQKPFISHSPFVNSNASGPRGTRTPARLLSARRLARAEYAHVHSLQDSCRRGRASPSHFDSCRRSVLQHSASPRSRHPDFGLWPPTCSASLPAVCARKSPADFLRGARRLWVARGRRYAPWVLWPVRVGAHARFDTTHLSRLRGWLDPGCA